MRTLGIDLAADPSKTAACLVAWGRGEARTAVLEAGCTDERLLELARESERIGIDSPLGWPDGFVTAISDHSAGRPWPGLAAPDPRAFRRTLSFRATDEAVTGFELRPLSVSTDRLGVTAMRCVLLLGLLAATGRSVERDGSGDVVEVYPAGALQRWGLPHRGYKRGAGARPARARIIEGIEQAPWLRLDERRRAQCLASDHMLDALVSALVTRAAAVGLTEPPPDVLVEQARREGWIHLPAADSLLALAD
jgi:predicted nuclease with RNAse H fold